jgi:NhaP-type Na+/H+ or K+/H+ antiporter
MFKKKFNMHNEEFHILFLSGLVRGAVPFVLFSSVAFTQDSRYSKNEGVVLKTTIIFIIIFTSVVLNSVIPFICKKKLKKISHV